MNKEKIARINALARKSRETGLTEAEKLEQQELRKEYIEAYKASLRSTLDNTYIMDEKGNKRPLNLKN